MSLSKPRTNTSPVQRRFELKLAVGSVTHYDSESKSNVTITGPAGAWELDADYDAAPPFKLIVLDVLSFIGGFNEPTNSGIWSNEIRSTRDEKLTVRTSKGVLVEGLYADIKGDIAKDGGKFGNSVYLAYQDGGEWKIGNLKLIGAGVSAFFDFKEGKFLDQDPGVAITGWVGKKKGRNEYFQPVFTSFEVNAADLASASALDESLQEFLSSAGAPKDPAEESYSVPQGQQSFAAPDEDPWTAKPPF